MSERDYLREKKSQRKQLVVLLGAGAAMPWKGISTDEIRNIFVSDTKYQTKTGAFVGEYLFKMLNKFYLGEVAEDKEYIANFETVISALETILNHILNSTNNGFINPTNTSFPPAILDLKKILESDLFEGEEKDDKIEHAYDIFSHFINLVMRKVNQYNINVLNSEFDSTNQNLIDFTSFFVSKGYSIKFYTTNYDSIIPQVLKPHFKVYEGLRDFNEEYKRFDFDLNKFKIAQLSHFNIHGSIYLNQELIHGETLIETETVYYSSFQSFPITGFHDHAGNPNEKLFFSPIIAGYNKTQRAVNKPFNLGFNALINDCNECSALLTVGCSFSDSHINSILSAFINWDTVKFVNVTRCKENFRGFEFSQIKDCVTPIYHHFEDESWLHDIDNSEHVYKLGFEEFLKNKTNWNSLLS